VPKVTTSVLIPKSEIIYKSEKKNTLVVQNTNKNKVKDFDFIKGTIKITKLL